MPKRYDESLTDYEWTVMAAAQATGRAEDVIRRWINAGEVASRAYGPRMTLVSVSSMIAAHARHQRKPWKARTPA